MEMKIIKNNEDQWGKIYRTGAISAIIVIGGIVADITIAGLTGGSVSALPQTAAGRFAQLHQEWWLGLYHLDLLNVVNQFFLIPVYFAVYAMHREMQKAFSLLALIVFLVGATIFIADNAALPMYDLSIKYYSAAAAVQKDYLAAAGEAVLARSAHGSTGALIGYILPGAAGIIMSYAMLKGKIFGRLNSWAGILGSLLIVLYTILVTFNAHAKDMAVVIALPGGILELIWLAMTASVLIKQASIKTV